MSTQSKKNRKGKMNAVDILFLLVFLLIIMVFIGYAFFSDFSFFAFGSNKAKRNVEYTFVVEPVKEILLTEDGKLPIAKGDAFYCHDHKVTLGAVASVKGKKAAQMPVGQKEGTLVYADYPGMYSFEVTVVAEATVENGSYYVNDHVVRIGDSFTFTTPYFMGTCRCVAVEEVS